MIKDGYQTEHRIVNFLRGAEEEGRDPRGEGCVRGHREMQVILIRQ